MCWLKNLVIIFVIIYIYKKKVYLDICSYNAGGVITGNGDLVDESKWLFNVIDPIFNDFKKRYGFLSEKFYLFGHSAGGGFRFVRSIGIKAIENNKEINIKGS